MSAEDQEEPWGWWDRAGWEPELQQVSFCRCSMGCSSRGVLGGERTLPRVRRSSG